MKHKNIAKRVLACGLAVAMVVTSGNYSSVNVFRCLHRPAYPV